MGKPGNNFGFREGIDESLIERAQPFTMTTKPKGEKHAIFQSFLNKAKIIMNWHKKHEFFYIQKNIWTTNPRTGSQIT